MPHPEIYYTSSKNKYDIKGIYKFTIHATSLLHYKHLLEMILSRLLAWAMASINVESIHAYVKYPLEILRRLAWRCGRLHELLTGYTETIVYAR